MKRYDNTLTSISFRVLPRIKEALRRRAMQRAADMKRTVTVGEVARDVLSIGLDLTEIPEVGTEQVVRGDAAGAERSIRAIVQEELDGTDWRFSDPRAAADQILSRVLEAFGFGREANAEEDRDWYFTVLLLSISEVLERQEQKVDEFFSGRRTPSNDGMRRRRWLPRWSERTDVEDDHLPDMMDGIRQEAPWWPEE